jgi:hypothetical protein
LVFIHLLVIVGIANEDDKHTGKQKREYRQ